VTVREDVPAPEPPSEASAEDLDLIDATAARRQQGRLEFDAAQCPDEIRPPAETRPVVSAPSSHPAVLAGAVAASRPDGREAVPVDEARAEPSSFLDPPDDDPQLALLYLDEVEGGDALELLDSEDAFPDETEDLDETPESLAPPTPAAGDFGFRPRFDWSALDAELEPAELDEAPTADEVRMQVRTDGGLSRWERARQVALEVAWPHGWDRAGIELLAEVFDAHWWSAAKRSMERELAAGMTPEELRLALAAREIWRSHLEFATDFRTVSRYSTHSGAADRYRVLSWPQALRLVRAFGGLPEPEEIELFLERLFDEWYSDPDRRSACPSFHRYLHYRLVLGHDIAPEWPEWTFEPDEVDDADSEDVHDPGICNRWFAAVNRFGLLPAYEPPGHLPTTDPQARR